jgi:hypothetical protein
MMQERDKPYLDWVPVGVRRVADSMLAAERPEDERTLLKRLLTDQRMQSVWGEIAKRPASSDTRKEFLLFETTSDDLTDHDVAVGVFFFRAYLYAYARVETETLANWKATLSPMLESIKRLRQEARNLPGRSSFAVLKSVAAIQAGADRCERELLCLYPKHPTVVRRLQGHSHQRAYAVLMSDQAQKWFGRPMYGTVATVTNVALKRDDTTWEKVRDWVKAAP